ncbi:MAG: hypothetical protein ACREMJ_02355, partial [Gemmatimonadales bacterium]
MNVVIRRYRIRLGAVELVARYARETLLPRLRQVSGFVAYYLVNAGDGLVASVALFENADGGRAGDSLSAEWFRVDWPAFRAVPPAMTSGEVLLAEESRRVAATPIAGGVPRLERRTLV